MPRGHHTLSCLRIVGGTAYLSGKVTESDAVTVLVGYDAWFAVRQGIPDQITLVLTNNTLLNCSHDYSTSIGGFHNIEGDSINIHT